MEENVIGFNFPKLCRSHLDSYSGYDDDDGGGGNPIQPNQRQRLRGAW